MTTKTLGIIISVARCNDLSVIIHISLAQKDALFTLIPNFSWVLAIVLVLAVFEGVYVCVSCSLDLHTAKFTHCLISFSLLWYLILRHQLISLPDVCGKKLLYGTDTIVTEYQQRWSKWLLFLRIKKQCALGNITFTLSNNTNATR